MVDLTGLGFSAVEVALQIHVYCNIANLVKYWEFILALPYCSSSIVTSGFVSEVAVTLWVMNMTIIFIVATNNNDRYFMDLVITKVD